MSHLPADFHRKLEGGMTTLPAAAPDGASDLVQRLNGASQGYDEWRVQDPKDGSYRIAYSWPDSINPQREARAWLAYQQQRFPNGRYADYVVACVRVLPQKDRLLAEAAAEIERLRADAERWRKLRDTPATAVAPGPMRGWLFSRPGGAESMDRMADELPSLSDAAMKQAQR